MNDGYYKLSTKNNSVWSRWKIPRVSRTIHFHKLKRPNFLKTICDIHYRTTMTIGWIYSLFPSEDNYCR